MEVHAHAHTPRKKWTHYLWEFFMLFLAVFCGFLAEYQLEHQIEKDREKKLMGFLLDDLREDTAEISKSISSALKSMRYEDSLMFYIDRNPSPEFLPEHFLEIDLYALLRLKIIFNESTAQQLKNAGNLRLIHKDNVARQISLYWNQQEYTRIDLERYLEYRNRSREFEESLFSYFQFNLVEAGLINPPPKGVHVIRSGSDSWMNYGNIISHCHITVKNYLDELNQSMVEAVKLVELIKKEYHLE